MQNSVLRGVYILMCFSSLWTQPHYNDKNPLIPFFFFFAPKILDSLNRVVELWCHFVGENPGAS